jgi:hypothetical protein
MTNIKIFCISGGTFDGFETSIDMDNVESANEIIMSVVNKLYSTLQKMRNLISQLDEEKSQYHIHDLKFGDILLGDIDRIYYICSHC